MKAKKILITGVFGTGKTTLINNFTQYLNKLNISFHISPDVARTCPFDLNKNQNIKTSLYLALKQLKNERRFDVDNYAFVISDRGLPDIISHTKYILEKEVIDANLFSLLKEFGGFSCHHYDYIFYSKIAKGISLDSDKIRLTDSTFQRALERIQLDYLESLELPFITLPDLTNDRILFMKKILDLDIKNALQHFV